MSVITEGAVNLVSAVFNVLMSASYNADFRRKDATNVANQEKVRDSVCEIHDLGIPFDSSYNIPLHKGTGNKNKKNQLLIRCSILKS